MHCNILDPFLQWVNSDPKRIAVADLKEAWSYDLLYEKACHIALTLASHKNSKVNKVAILGNKSNASIAAILGALFADLSYCPLDINLPAQRLDKILSILSPMGLITTGLSPALKQVIKDLQMKPDFVLDLCGDFSPELLEGVKRLHLIEEHYSVKQHHQNPAYIIFTSGSTGTPKGVAISHYAADSALNMFQDHIRIQEHDKICNQVALCFDLSVFDIFGSLREGASIYLMPASVCAVPNKFIQYLLDNKITSLFTVPSTLNYISENTNINLRNSSIKNLMLSGEPIPSFLLRKIHHFFPDAINIWNLYGATEIPYVLAEKLDHDTDLANYFSLKGKSVEVSIDPLGELLVKSRAMLSGYYREGIPGLSLPFREDHWYPTGDRASIDHHGNITILGRIDRQVKIQGHRIELDEIEHVLESYAEIQEAAVIYLQNEKQLYAFIVLHSDFLENNHFFDLEERCKASLPLIMCPQHYCFISDMPHTASGKKDRKMLMEKSHMLTSKNQSQQIHIK